MTNRPQQLVEGRHPLPRLEVFLDYVKLAVSEDVASQKLPLKIPTVGIFR